MYSRLKRDALLTAGLSDQPVDLVSRSSGARLPLSADDAAIAMLLLDGTDDLQSLAVAAGQQGIVCTLDSLRALMDKLTSAGLLESGPAAPPPAPAAAPPAVARRRSVAAAPPPAVRAAPPPTPPPVRAAPPPTPPLDRREAKPTRPPSPPAPPLLPEAPPAVEPASSSETAWDDAVTEVAQPAIHLASLRMGVVTERNLAAIMVPCTPEISATLPPFGAGGPDDNEKPLPDHDPDETPLPPVPATRGTLAEPTALAPRRSPLFDPDTALPPAGSLPGAVAQPGTPRWASTGAALARVALLVRSREHSEALALLAGLIERDPGNEQALAMAELIRAQVGTTRARRRWRWLLAAMALLLLASALVAGFVVRLPQEAETVCRARPIDGPTIRTAIAGRVKTTTVARGQLIRKGQVLAEVHDEAARARLPGLREQIRSQEELLQIMKTGGSDAAERQQKEILRRLKPELASARTRCGDRPDCKAAVAELQLQLDRARQKLHFCEWQALPAEIESLEKQILELREQLEDLSGRPLQTALESPADGVLVFIRASGEAVKATEEVARLAEPRRFQVQTSPIDWTPGGAPAQVSLSAAKSVQSYQGQVRRRTEDGGLWLEIEADVSKAHLDGGCTARLPGRRVSLARWLIQRLRQR